MTRKFRVKITPEHERTTIRLSPLNIDYINALKHKYKGNISETVRKILDASLNLLLDANVDITNDQEYRELCKDLRRIRK